MATLLEEISLVCHDERVARVVELGRRSAHDPKAREAIDGLERGDAFARMLATWSCYGSRDGSRVLRALGDRSERVRELALRLVAVACDDAQAFDALQIAFGARRDKFLLARLADQRRLGVVDHYLDWLAERPGIHDFADYVPLGSAAALRRHLDKALARPSAIFWKRMARLHADVLGEILEARIAAAPGESDPVTRQLVGRYHRTMAERAPDRALAIAELLEARSIETAPSVWLALWKTRMVEVLSSFERRQKPLTSFTVTIDRLAAVPHDVLARLVRADVSIRGKLEDLDEERRRVVGEAWADVCERFPRRGSERLAWASEGPRRERAYLLWRAATSDADGVIAPSGIEKLPIDLREREARRHLDEVVALRTRPKERLAYARFLPWDEARAAVADYIGHPEGELRGVAIGALLQVVTHRPADAALARQALEMVLARKNEQDPVRNAMLAALLTWPRDRWRREHTAAIGQMLRDALDASDLSPATASHGERLLVRTFHLDPTWGASMLAVWLKERGHVLDARLGEHMTPEEVRAAADVLLATATTWAQQDRHHMVLHLASSLGERMKLIPGFFDAVERSRDRIPWGAWAVELTKLIREHDPERYERTLPALTRAWLDKGWYGELCHLAFAHDRGDSLHEDLALALERIISRTGSQAQVVHAMSALRSRARRRFGERIGRMLEADPSLVVLPAVYQFLHRRRQDLLRPYLEGRVVTGRFATGDTAWVLPFLRGFWRWTSTQCTLFCRQHARIVRDEKRDTPTILSSLTVMPELCWAPMDDLLAFCDDARPVVAEKAMRVVARCDQAQGVPVLLRCLEDVRARVAIYGLRRALRGLPPARAFALLRDVPLKKVTVAKEVVRLLGELRSDDAYAHLIALDGTELHRDVRIALLRALWDHLEREPTWQVFERAIEAPDWIMAAKLGAIPADRLTKTTDVRLSALLARVLSRKEPEARLALLQRAYQVAVQDPERTFLAACRARIPSPYDDEVTAAVRATLARSTEADIPTLRATLDAARSDARALSVAVKAILQHGRSRRVYVLAAAAAEEVTSSDPALAPARVRCARVARPDQLASVLEQIAAAGHLSSDVIIEARDAIASLPFDDLPALESALASSTHAELRRLAVRVLERDAGRERGWTSERLERLAIYQRDRSPIVAGAANALFPPRELAPRTGSP